MKVQSAIAAMAITTTACASDTPPTRPTPIVEAPTPAIRLSGRVVDYQTGAGVPGISIRWTSFKDGEGFGRPISEPTVSDASGRYEVALPVADRYSFQVPFAFEIVPGDLRSSGLMRVPGKRLETDILVKPGTCAARYGIVFDALTRAPIAGARVSRAGTATTDAQGRYRIDIGCEQRDWGFGTTTISVQHPNYQSSFEFDGRREFTGGSLRRFDFALTPLP